ncbi:MAG: NAD(P)-dependent oxidoreductase [Oscillospiraceae bacterium]
MKIAVVTGGTSFIGAQTVRLLLSKSYKVFAIVREGSKNLAALPENSNLQIVMADMWDTDKWVNAIGNADLFFHLGWDGVGAEGRANIAVQNKNIDMTLACLKGASLLRCSRFVFAGTQAEYGEHFDEITEETPCNPIIEYGKAKLAVYQKASILAKKLNIQYIHTRIFSVYGKGDHEWALIPSCVKAFCKNESIALSHCTQKWNFMHVSDTAAALVALAQSEKSAKYDLYNVASADTRVLKEFVKTIYSLTGCNAELQFGSRLNMREKPVSLMPSVSRLTEVCNFKACISFENGIQELIALERKKV